MKAESNYELRITILFFHFEIKKFGGQNGGRSFVILFPHSGKGQGQALPLQSVQFKFTIL